MNKTIDSHHKIDKHQTRETDELSNFITKLTLTSISKSKHISDIKDGTDLSIEHGKHDEKVDELTNQKDSNQAIDKLDSVSENTYSGEMRSIFDRVNNVCDLLSRSLISHEEFIRLMEQVKKDKEEFEEAYRKHTIEHRVEDFQGMLSVFVEGSQSFLATKAAISQLNSML